MKSVSFNIDYNLYVSEPLKVHELMGKVIFNPFFREWEIIEFFEIPENDIVFLKSKEDINEEQIFQFLMDSTIKNDRQVILRQDKNDLFFVTTSTGSIDGISLSITVPPFPSTQSTAESFRDFALSFIWDYSLLKSFSVDVPILEKQSDAIVRITKIAAEAIISYTWFKILSPYEYETRYTKAQLLAAPAYRVEELPEDRVLIQSYPNPFEEDALVLAAYFGPLHEYLEKVRLENKSNPEVQAIVQRRIAELNKARFEKFGE
jgi:hypothetical protein